MTKQIIIVLFIVIFQILSIILNKKGFEQQIIKYMIVYILLFVVLIYKKQFYLLFIFLTFLNQTFLTSIKVILHGIKLFLYKDIDSFYAISRSIFKDYKPIILPKNPTIFISNYPSDYLEYTIPGLFEGKICVVLFKGAYDALLPIFGKEKLICVSDNKKQFNFVKNEIQDRISKGYSIFVYPEKKYYERKNIYSMTIFRNGIFKIAKDLQVTITPLVTSHFDFNFFQLDNNFKIYIFPSLTINNVEKDVKYCQKIMLKKLYDFRYKKL